MADNIAVTEGVGKTVATDDVGGAQYQRVKLDVGGDGVSSPVTTIAKETGGNLDTIAGDTTSIDGKITACNTGAVVVSSSALPTGAATAAKQDTGNTSLATLAGAVAGTEVQVDVVASLPAGTNAIGKLAANSGVDIGDVDVASIAAGDNNIGNVDIASAIPAGDNNIGNVDIASAIPTGTNTIGAVKQDVINWTPITPKHYASSGAATDGIIWSPTSGKKWVCTKLIFNCSTDSIITFEDDLAGGDATRLKFDVYAKVGATFSFLPGEFISAENDADLIVTNSAGNLYVTAFGYEV